MKISQTKLILYSSIFLVVFDNFTFFQHVTEVYPITLKNIGFLSSLAVGLTAFINLLFTLVSSRFTTKPIVIFMLLVSAVTAYFVNNYNVVINHTMIQNMLETNLGETADLLTPKLGYYLFLLGIVPSYLVIKAQFEPLDWKQAITAKLKSTLLSVVIVLGLVLLFSKFYTSFFREHESLRYYTNPTYVIYSVSKYINRTFNTAKTVIQPQGHDAELSKHEGKQKLIIIVVGEAARKDHFSLNGYQKETTPLLQKEDVTSFTNMYSCGTSTAYSVPCMFSIFPRDQYNDRLGTTNENLLDVLSHAGVHVLWRDNNSDSKGVALRVTYQDYSQPGVNPICDVECRDVGMLVGLQEYAEAQPEGDIVIVLHQMGNHGPAYYKRYPAEFEKFTPTCKTNQFDKCTTEEISNTYDNGLLYTDFFLSKVIELLKDNSNRFATAMIYMSDHGESLGEYGVYLHGLPYAMAPDNQKHIASVFWFADNFNIDQKALREKAAMPFSHDNLTHTMLGLLGIKTALYDRSLDILQN